ncbi:MAG: PTS sugar transporter subunit IIA [Planctomycetota bacterium]|jgi:mannitol/fructose-specific phosphotransferase system IIA component (Ntr-type)
MKLSDLLQPDMVLLPLEAGDKWQAIDRLAELGKQAGILDEKQLGPVREALEVREKSMTTGMEMGIAIPHAAVDEIDEVVASLGITRDGIDFEALDGQPANIIVCLVIPRSKKLLHIKTLAGIAKLLARGEVREAILDCGSGSEVVDKIRQMEAELG